MQSNEYENYIQGYKDGLSTVIKMFEMTTGERQRRFGYELVADILDHYDYAEIKAEIESMDKKELHTYYIIRIITEDKEGFKKVSAESKWYPVHPTFSQIEEFMNPYDDKSFAVVEQILVLEEG